MKKVVVFVSVLLIISGGNSFAQEAEAPAKAASNLSLSVSPGVSIPLGKNADLFGFGGDVKLSGRYRLSSLPMFFLGGQVGYNLSPIVEGTSLSTLTAGVSSGITKELSPKFGMSGFAEGGAFFSMLSGNQGSAVYPYAAGGAGLHYRLNRSLSLGLEASYRYFFGLSSGIVVGLGATYHAPKRTRAPIRIESGSSQQPQVLRSTTRKARGRGVEVVDVEFKVFPVLFKYYDESPVGNAVLVNYENDKIENVRVSLLVKQYMDNPKECIFVDSLPGKSELTFDLYALFTSDVLEISEGTKVSANITVEYTRKGKEQREELVETLRFFNRNAVTWDDDRKAAAFVTSKDVAVQKFAKNVAGMVKDKASRTLNQNLLMGIALHETLTLYDVSYVIDPTTPYVEFSKNEQAIDYLQFPNQTLENRAGDCDDLSILYCSLLEALGVKTAFVTIPEHIFVAFSLDMRADQARKSFAYPDDLILYKDTAWIPVEVTARDGGFLNAWRIGAKQWREHFPKNQAGFFPLDEAWKTYEPVGFTIPGDPVQLPNKDRVVRYYLEQVMKFIDREIFEQREELVSHIKQTGSLRARNSLGVLYARYGLNEEAEQEFQKVLAQREYVPTLVNMGNISYLKDDLSTAKYYYDRAARKAPDNPAVLVSLARVNHEIENYSEANVAYSKLKSIDPALAEQFAFLESRGSETARAADINKMKGVVVWDEE
jgi:tetratricopeptide (TPR) repeat protein